MTGTESSYQRSGLTKTLRSQAKLVAAAEAMFSEHGWHDTSLDKIASRAGISPPTARKYYNKRSLMAEVYAPLVSSLREQVSADLAEVDPLEATERVVRRLCELARSRPNLTIAMLTAVREETVMDDGSSDADVLRRQLRISDVMCTCLRAAQEGGLLSPALPVLDVASYHTNALLLRLFVDTSEGPNEMTELVLTQLRPVLKESRVRES